MNGAAVLRVLVVDDSPFMRQLVTRELERDGDIRVAGVACDGLEAVARVHELCPDVVTMDVEMPRLDGLAALARIMAERPTAVVMLSSLTAEAAEPTLRALELGAVDFVQKPDRGRSLDLSSIGLQLRQKVRGAARASLRRLAEPMPARPAASPPRAALRRPLAAVCIGASTGGPRAPAQLVPELGAALDAAVLIVQHMPAGFTGPFARRLHQAGSLRVKEAEDGDMAAAGLALLAPGGRHLEVASGGRVRLHDGPAVHGVRPSVDVMLRSAAAAFGRRCIAVVLTGMGEDGAEGARSVKEHGGRVVAESAETAVIYGMPRAVIERGLADEVLPLHRVAGAVQRAARALAAAA